MNVSGWSILNHIVNNRIFGHVLDAVKWQLMTSVSRTAAVVVMHCWARQPLPLGYAFDKTEHKPSSFLVSQSGSRCSTWSPVCRFEACLKEYDVFEACLYLSLNHCNCVITLFLEQGNISSILEGKRMKMLIQYECCSCCSVQSAGRCWHSD